MRLSLIASAIIGTTLAASSELLVARDLNTVTMVLKNVTSNVENLTNVAKTGNANPGTLLKASDGIIQAIRSGTVAIKATGNLTFVETVHLIGPVHDMSTLSSGLTKNMVKLKASIEKQSLCDVVRLQIGNINQGAEALIGAINSKVPSAALDISEALSQGITDTLKSIQDEFSTQNCVDGRIEIASSSTRLIISLGFLFPISLILAAVLLII